MNFSGVTIEHLVVFLRLRGPNQFGNFVDVRRRHLFVAAGHLVVMQCVLLVHLLHLLLVLRVQVLHVRLVSVMLRLEVGLHSLVRLLLRQPVLFVNCFEW